MSASKGSKIGKKTHKIIFLGDSGVGKTALIDKFANNRFEDFFNPTIGVDFVSKDIKFRGSACRFQLWDTAGQQKFKSLVPTYLKDAVCCVLVFDVSAPLSLAHLEEWVSLFRENKKERALSIICGSKSDLQRNFEKEQLQQLIEKYRMPYYAISAKTGQGIDELFFKIAEMLEQQEAEKHRKLKQTYCEEYDNPPPTFESLTRSQTHQNAVAEEEKEKVPLTTGTHPKPRCQC